MKRWIMHVDMDAFFASVEQRDNPELAGLPVIVGGQSARGVVSTCSYEARRFGVHSAMPIVEARRLCPKGCFVVPRMAHYQAVSKEIMTVFAEHSPLVEPLSIDEAFLDISCMEGLYPNVEAIGVSVKKRIKEVVRLNASVGIAPNKFLAKLGSDLRKPDGLVIINAEEAETLLAPMPVRKIFGIGKMAERKLAQYGIVTIGQIAQTDLWLLQKVFGVNAYSIQQLARGIDNRPVVPETEAKSIGKEHTFEEDILSRAEALKAVKGLCCEVGWRLRAQKAVGHTITLKVKYASFKMITRSSTTEIPISFDEELIAAAVKLLDSIKLTEGVRLLGITISGLEPETLLAELGFAENDKMKRVNQAVDALKNKFGEQIIKRC